LGILDKEEGNGTSEPKKSGGRRDRDRSLPFGGKLVEALRAEIQPLLKDLNKLDGHIVTLTKVIQVLVAELKKG